MFRQTCGCPRVSVPVLSKMTVVALESVSSAAPPLISTPFWAPTCSGPHFRGTTRAHTPPRSAHHNQREISSIATYKTDHTRHGTTGTVMVALAEASAAKRVTMMSHNDNAES